MKETARGPSGKSRLRPMEQRELFRTTCSIAWPAAVEALLINIVELVDMAMISRLGLTAVAAVGLTAQPRRILLMPVLALNTGATVLVSRRLGEGSPQEANRCMRQFLLLSAAVSALVYGGGFCLARPFLLFSGADADTLGDAVGYFRILMGGQLLHSVSLTINACLRAAGKTRVSMTTNVAANAVNVVFNYLLIFGNLGFPRWEVAGAAAATALGSLSALCISLWSVRRGAGGVLFLTFAPAAWRLEPKKLLTVRGIVLSAFSEQLCQRIGLFLFTRLAASLGMVEFALYQIVMNIANLQGYTYDGVATAATTLTGQSLGAEEAELADRYNRIALRIGYGIATAIAAGILLFRRQLLGFFIEEADVAAAGCVLLLLVEAASLPCCGAVVYFGALRGAGDTKAVARVTLIIVAVIRPAVSWALCYPLGLRHLGVWAGYFIAHVLRWWAIRAHYRRGTWKTIRV